jgi:hypothetical protein
MAIGPFLQWTYVCGFSPLYTPVIIFTMWPMSPIFVSPKCTCYCIFLQGGALSVGGDIPAGGYGICTVCIYCKHGATFLNNIFDI